MRIRQLFAPFWHISDLEAQIVAETGNPLDRHHLGKLMLKGLRSYPEWTIQVDAAVDKSETSTSVLSRSIRCAYSMKQRGLGVGDVVVFMAPNHLDQCIPFYAAAYLGVVSFSIEHNSRAEELSRHFKTTQPKLVFCQAANYENATKALESAGVKADVITFDQSEHYTFGEFMKEAADDVDIEGFKATDLNPEDAILCLIPTSGTTGLPKTAATTHKGIVLGLPYFWHNVKIFHTNVRVDEIRDLGLKLNSKLDFHSDVVSTCKSASKSLGFIIRTAAQFRDPRVAIILYNAFVRTKLEFGAIVWDPHEKKYNLMLEKIQRKFARWLYKKRMNYTNFPQDIRALVVSTPQWYTGLLHYYCSAIYIYTRIQTSRPFSCEHFTDIFRIHKPNNCCLSPSIFSSLMNYEEFTKLDLSFSKIIGFGGSFVSEDFYDKVKSFVPNAAIGKGYGMSETSGSITYMSDYPKNSIGAVVGALDLRLIDPETGKDIEEPNVVGELWVHGPMVFKGYYNNPEATKETFSEDGWFMTGDLMYRDEHGYLYYVDRKKLMIKFRNHQISPIEIEGVISAHPAVLEVVVSSIQDDDVNDLPVACIVKRPDVNVTAQEIKDLVKEHLSECKQLRGGVVFMDSLPMTPSMKIHRKAIKQLILTMDLE